MDEGVDGWNTEKEYGLIAAGFGNCARDARNVLVIGTAEAEKVREVAENLSERLEGAAVTASENLLEEERILRMLPDCDCIVLVEQCAVSFCRDIARELEAVCDLHKTVAGCVVFE